MEYYFSSTYFQSSKHKYSLWSSFSLILTTAVSVLHIKCTLVGKAWIKYQFILGCSFPTSEWNNVKCTLHQKFKRIFFRTHVLIDWNMEVHARWWTGWCNQLCNWWKICLHLAPLTVFSLDSTQTWRQCDPASIWNDFEIQEFCQVTTLWSRHSVRIGFLLCQCTQHAGRLRISFLWRSDKKSRTYSRRKKRTRCCYIWRINANYITLCPQKIRSVHFVSFWLNLRKFLQSVAPVMQTQAWEQTRRAEWQVTWMLNIRTIFHAEVCERVLVVQA